MTLILPPPEMEPQTPSLTPSKIPHTLLQLLTKPTSALLPTPLRSSPTTLSLRLNSLPLLLLNGVTFLSSSGLIPTPDLLLRCMLMLLLQSLPMISVSPESALELPVMLLCLMFRLVLMLESLRFRLLLLLPLVLLIVLISSLVGLLKRDLVVELFQRDRIGMRVLVLILLRVLPDLLQGGVVPRICGLCLVW